jgi:hypothetical protein
MTHKIITREFAQCSQGRYCEKVIIHLLTKWHCESIIETTLEQKGRSHCNSAQCTVE